MSRKKTDRAPRTRSSEASSYLRRIALEKKPPRITKMSANVSVDIRSEAVRVFGDMMTDRLLLS